MITGFGISLLLALLVGAILVRGMADPTGPVAALGNWKPYDGFSKAKIVDTEQLVINGLVAEIAENGELQFLAAEAGAWPVGTVETPTFGKHTVGLLGTGNDDETDTGASARGEMILRGVTVTGATSYATKGRPVYGTDGQTMTLTRPATDAVPMGYVWDKIRDATGTTVDIYVFGKHSSWMLAANGGVKRSVMLGIIHTTALEATAAVDLFTIIMYGHGLITKLFAKATGFDAGYVAGSQVLNLEIGATNLTGGALTVAESDIDLIGDMATNIDATAITAANEFHDGDVVTCELGASGTGFTAAIDTVSFEIWVDIVYLPGA